MKYLANFEKQNNNILRNSVIGAGIVGTGLATGTLLKPQRFLGFKNFKNKVINANPKIKPTSNKVQTSSSIDTGNIEPVEDFRVDTFRTELGNNPLLQLQYVNSMAQGAKKGKQAVTRRRMQLETMPEYLDLKDKRIAKTGKNAGNVKKTRAKGKNKKERQNAINEIKKRKQALVQRINSDREMGSYFNNYNIKSIGNF